MIPMIMPLLNAGSKSMKVNGSITPKNFSYTASETIAVLGMICVFKDDGTTSLDKMGAITALTNGVLIQANINGVATEVTTVKDNADLCSRFHFSQFGNGAVLSVLGIGAPQGFGNSNNVFIGFMEFNHPHEVILNPGDSIEAIVQDDLSGIDLFNMSAKLSKEQ